MDRSRRLSYMRKILSRAHWEPQRAKNPEDARNYCAKVDDPTFVSGPYEHGTFRGQGARSDLTAVKEALDNGKSDVEIADSHFNLWVSTIIIIILIIIQIRYHKSFTAYRLLKEAPRKEIKNVWVIYGSPGTGKTYLVSDSFEDLYRAVRPNNSAFYFENYHGEEAMLFDDFYGWLPRDFLLQLCQPYPFRLPYRGGEANCSSTSICFTSNRVPWKWWKGKHGEELDISNFIRRVTKWIYFTGYKTYFETPSYESFRSKIEEAEKNTVVNQVQ